MDFVVLIEKLCFFMVFVRCFIKILLLFIKRRLLFGLILRSVWFVIVGFFNFVFGF